MTKSWKEWKVFPSEEEPNEQPRDDRTPVEVGGANG